MPKDTVPRKFMKTQKEYSAMSKSELQSMKDSLSSYQKPLGSGYALRNATLADYKKRINKALKSK